MVSTRKADRLPGRRTADKVAYGIVHFLKLAAMVIGALSTAVSAGMGAYFGLYFSYQAYKDQVARDIKSAPPPKPVTPLKSNT